MIAAERKAEPKATEAAIHAKMTGLATPIVNLFGSQPGEPAFNQDFESTLDQTLFLSNGPTLRDWLTPRPGSLTERAIAHKDAGLVAEELYLSVLARLPSADERKEVTDYLTRRAADRNAAIQDLAGRSSPRRSFASIIDGGTVHAQASSLCD